MASTSRSIAVYEASGGVEEEAMVGERAGSGYKVVRLLMRDSHKRLCDRHYLAQAGQRRHQRKDE
jgi:hypothetical protein